MQTNMSESDVQVTFVEEKHQDVKRDSLSHKKKKLTPNVCHYGRLVIAVTENYT